MNLLRRLGSGLAGLTIAAVSAVPAVFLHPLLWPLPLVALTAASLVLALPPGTARVGFAVGWAGALLTFAVRRPEGDTVVTGSLSALLLVVLALVWTVIALVTLPSGPARDSHPGTARP